MTTASPALPTATACGRTGAVLQTVHDDVAQIEWQNGTTTWHVIVSGDVSGNLVVMPNALTRAQRAKRTTTATYYVEGCRYCTRYPDERARCAELHGAR